MRQSRYQNLHQLRVFKSQSTGFTLIELLVVIAIIALLMGILLPALGHAQTTARSVREQSGMRQTMLAYTMYSQDNRDKLLVGFPDTSMFNRMAQRNEDPKDFNGDSLGWVIGARYPWRLISYFDGNFEALYQDQRVIEALSETEGNGSGSAADHRLRYVISLYPSFGLNTYFVGGGASGDPIPFSAIGRQLYGKIHVSKMFEPRRPSNLMVFSSAREMPISPPLNEVGILEGYFRITPPSLYSNIGRRWGDEYEDNAAQPGNNSGFVSLRYNGKGIAGMMDGHAEQWGWDDYNDMQHWSDRATKADWVLEPRLP